MTFKNKAKGFAIGALVICAAGYIAGILTALKSGRETREQLSRVKQKGLLEAERQLRQVQDELNGLIGEAQVYVSDGKSRHQMNEVIEGEVVTKATKARQKAKDILAAINSGEADDRDLDKAVIEASKAIKSLRKYLKK